MGRGAKVCGDEVAQVIGVVGGIRDDMADALQPVDQAARLWTAAPLPQRDCEPDRQAERIHGGVDLGCQAAFRASGPGSLKPLFERSPACVLQIVALIRTYSKSGSWLNALKRFSQTPASVHLRNREWNVRQFPNSGGRSRHGLAPRASQRMASATSLLSVPLRPRSPTLPGTRGSMIAHWASVGVRLLKIASCLRS